MNFIVNNSSSKVQLANFHHYSFHNCMALRKIQLLVNTCDCIPFFFPKKDFYRICNFHDMECLEKVISPPLFGDKVANDSEQAKNEHAETLSRCLPECEHFDYPLEVALGKLSFNVPISGTSFFNNIVLENRSVVNVFFNDLVATRYRRDVYLNWQNILASFGGLLSLMLGFTLISGFDFILFFSIQVIYDFISRYFVKEELSNSAIVGRKGFIINIDEHKKDNWVKKAKKNKSGREIEKNIKYTSYRQRY